jgi:hypothetical protein
MSKQIVFSFPDHDVSAAAELLEDVAPETCRFVWDLLPLEVMPLHSMYCGPQIFGLLDPAVSLKSENQVHLPLPGEIVYLYQPGGVYVNTPEPYAEIAITYGRNVKIQGEGNVPAFASLFARFVGDWSAFEAECKRLRREGPSLLRIERGNSQ